MKTVITGGTLIDGTGSKPVKDSVVVFENGKITAVGAAEEFSLPKDAEVVDVSGRTVIPGLIDCHIHMDLHGYADTYDENLVEERLRVTRTVQDMEHTLKRGHYHRPEFRQRKPDRLRSEGRGFPGFLHRT